MRSKKAASFAGAAVVVSSSASAEPVATTAITHHALTFVVFGLVIFSTLLITGLRVISTRRAERSAPPRTAWRSLVITCPQRLFWVRRD
jgi:hypothetical protein